MLHHPAPPDEVQRDLHRRQRQGEDDADPVGPRRPFPISGPCGPTSITRRLCANVWNSPKILKAKHRSYQLQVIYTALNWWELLNYFRFEDPLYILFYTFLGAITVFEGFILWGLNRLLTKLRHPPIFHGATLFYTISEAPLKGTFYASVPYVLALSLVFHWFATPNQQYPRSEVTPPQLNSMEQTTTYVSSGTGWTPNPDNPVRIAAS